MPTTVVAAEVRVVGKVVAKGMVEGMAWSGECRVMVMARAVAVSRE